jgi:adenine deaminase
MLAGSDSGGAAWEVPGLALHQEFDELARAGLSPLRVLQLTTSNAAAFLDATAVMGSVDAGKRADLVLLEANPLESVDHLHRIGGVVRGGRYLGPADLGALKAKVARQSAAAPRVKRAKSKIQAGLQAVIVGYDELSVAYGEIAGQPEAASSEAVKAEVVVKKGRKQLSEGVKLLD